MSCCNHEKRDAVIAHLKHHTQRLCAHCQSPMTFDEDTLPFGDSVLSEWSCSRCHHTEMILIQKDGSLLEMKHYP